MDSKQLEKIRNAADASVGKRIDTLCNSSLAQNHSANQCAHYVSHILDYDFSQAASCKYLTFADKNNPDVTGATIRVDVLFNRFPAHRKQTVSEKRCYAPGLTFVTEKRNINSNGRMGDMPRKHIGILLWPWVYHYSNLSDAVKKQDMKFFIETFAQAYGGRDSVIFYRTDFIS